MSPAYIAPAVETIVEPQHGGRQGAAGVGVGAGDAAVHSTSGQAKARSLDMMISRGDPPPPPPPSRARRFSSKSDVPRKNSKFRSASPQLHHFLRGSPVAEEVRRGSSIPVAARPSLRRYSSADFLISLPSGPAKSGFEGPSASSLSLSLSPSSSGSGSGSGDGWMEGGSGGDRGRWAAKQLQEIREAKRARLSPAAAALPRPRSVCSSLTEASHHRHTRTSSGSASTIREQVSAREEEEEHVDEAACAGARDGAGEHGSGTTPADALKVLNGDLLSVAAQQSPELGDATTPWTHSTVAEGKLPSPSARSTTSSDSYVSSSPHSVASSERTADTDVSFPEREIDGDETPIAPVPLGVAINGSSLTTTTTTTTTTSSSLTDNNNNNNKRHSRGSSDPDRYGTPEMPRGTAKLPHIPASDLTPRVPNQGHPKHLPRAEKLPMSGYELLASSISASAPTTTGTGSASRNNRMSSFLSSCSTSATAAAAAAASNKYASSSSRRNSNASLLSASAVGTEEEALLSTMSTTTTIKPIYRRFEALNHRLLLHLQDELSELEEQLHRLDTTDTQTRRLQSSILPASRRAEFLAGGELQWHKTDILSKIGFKLGQYNHVLSSFTSTRDLPAPSITDVTDYRNYLATHRPISEVETRFLDPIDDLVTLTAPEGGSTHGGGGGGSATSSVVGGGDSGDAARPAIATAHQAAEDYCLHSLRINNNNQNNNNNNNINDDHVPIVTPIPGTMHGNSWLVRHKRLSHGSGTGSQSSSRNGSATSGSPRFSRHGSGTLEPLHSSTSSSTSHHHHHHHQQQQQHQHQQQLGMAASPRLPSSPLREAHSAVTEPDEKSATAAVAAAPPPALNAVGDLRTPTHVLLHVAFSMAVAVLVPILTFSVIPGFVGRMTVVLLVGLSVLGSVAQSGGMRKGVDSTSTDLVLSATIYVAVMAVVAGVMG